MATHFIVKHPILHSEPGAKPATLRRGHVIAAEKLSERDQVALLKAGAIVAHTPVEAEPEPQIVSSVRSLTLDEIMEPIAKFTKAQLAEYALASFGILSLNGTKEEMLAKIQETAVEALAKAASAHLANLPDTGAEG